MTYKNQLEPLVLPEYGRNIQNMVNHCVTIENRAERTRCARSIVDAMEILFPSQDDKQAHRRKLWDQLAIMSNYQLDVDIPFELVKADAFDAQPQPVSRPENHIRRRQYGHLMESLVDTIVNMDEGEARDELTLLCANHLKKILLTANPEGVEDYKVFKDLYEMSNGAINLSPDTTQLCQFTILPTATTKKKKKKK